MYCKVSFSPKLLTDNGRILREEPVILLTTQPHDLFRRDALVTGPSEVALKQDRQ